MKEEGANGKTSDETTAATIETAGTGIAGVITGTTSAATTGAMVAGATTVAGTTAGTTIAIATIGIAMIATAGGRARETEIETETGIAGGTGDCSPYALLRNS